MGNRQLARELLHDMQQAERQTTKQARAVAAAAAAAPARVVTPVGTSRHTPIAAEVIAVAAAAASPLTVAPRATPGSGLGPRVAAFTTPRAPSGSGAATSVPPQSTGGGSDTSSLSVPRLKGRGQRRMGPSRLKQDTTAAGRDDAEMADKENDGGADVVLPVPQPNSTAKVWRVSLVGEAEALLEGEDATVGGEEPVKAPPARTTRGRQARGKAVLQDAARSPAPAPRSRRGGSKRK